jgi:hypothetical protein
MRWKTQEVKGIIEKALATASFTEWLKIEVNEIGGDHDTETIQVTWGDPDERESLFICGFHCVNTNYDNGNSPEDMEIEMVELTDGKDSRGGLNSSNPNVCMGYGIIMSALRQAGFSVCPQMKDYF